MPSGNRLCRLGVRLPLGSHIVGVRYERTGTVENSHTPRRGRCRSTSTVRWSRRVVVCVRSPGSFGLAGTGIKVGSNPGQAVCGAYRAPFPFTGGVIHRAVVDISGQPYLDVERELARAFAKD